MKQLFAVDIPGVVPPKKNLKNFGANGGMYTSARVNDYAEEFWYQLKKSKQIPRDPYEGRVRIEIRLHYKRDIDLDNAEGMIFDAVQGAGVIKNDKQICENFTKKMPCEKGEDVHTEVSLFEL